MDLYLRVWAVRRCLAPEGVRLGPSPVRPRGSPGLRGPQRQAEGTGLPPYSRPPEVVAALAVHRAGFARSSRLSITLVRQQTCARPAPSG